MHFITFDRDKWKGGRGGGNDDYYNNGEYRTGFSYFNRGVGSRMLLRRRHPFVRKLLL